MKEHLKFEERPTLNKKTKRFNIISKNLNIQLGTISWYPQWRQYCFYPEENTVYSEGCLEEIFKFLEKLKSENKK